MLSRLPSRKHRLDVAAIRDNCGCIKFFHEMKIHVLETPWTFGLVDYTSGIGFEYEVCARAGLLTVSDGSHTFLEITGMSVSSELTIVLQVERFGDNFLAQLELEGLSPRVSLPALTLPNTTHLCAQIGLPEQTPFVRLGRWHVETLPCPNLEAIGLPNYLRSIKE